VRKAVNLPPSCAVVTKSGSLNFMEPSGPLRTCNGTAFYRKPSCSMRTEQTSRSYKLFSATFRKCLKFDFFFGRFLVSYTFKRLSYKKIRVSYNNEYVRKPLPKSRPVWCRSHLGCSYVRQFGVIDSRKLKL
jgi:hypothetical protein